MTRYFAHQWSWLNFTLPVFIKVFGYQCDHCEQKFVTNNKLKLKYQCIQMHSLPSPLVGSHCTASTPPCLVSIVHQQSVSVWPMWTEMCKLKYLPGLVAPFSLSSISVWTMWAEVCYQEQVEDAQNTTSYSWHPSLFHQYQCDQCEQFEAPTHLPRLVPMHRTPPLVVGINQYQCDQCELKCVTKNKLKYQPWVGCTAPRVGIFFSFISN